MKWLPSLLGATMLASLRRAGLPRPINLGSFCSSGILSRYHSSTARGEDAILHGEVMARGLLATLIGFGQGYLPLCSICCYLLPCLLQEAGPGSRAWACSPLQVFGLDQQPGLIVQALFMDVYLERQVWSPWPLLVHSNGNHLGQGVGCKGKVQNSAQS